MHPVLFKIGSLEFHSYGLMMAVAAFASIFLMRRAAKAEGFSTERISDIVLILVVAGIIGARLFYVLQHLSYYAADPYEIIKIWKGGLVYYGAVILGVIVLPFLAYAYKYKFLKLTDFFTPYVALALGIGRIGCFLNGCCYGKPSDLPWAVKFPTLAEKVHPVQLYAFAACVLVFFILRFTHKRKPFDGFTTALYFILYPAARLILEFFRGDNLEFIWGLTLPQVESLVLINVSALFLALGFIVNRKKENV